MNCKFLLSFLLIAILSNQIVSSQLRPSPPCYDEAQEESVPGSFIASIIESVNGWFSSIVGFLTGAETKKTPKRRIIICPTQRKWNPKFVKSFGISDFAQRVIDWMKSRGNGNVGKQCFDKKAKGLVPSAEKGDSPVKQFGYPEFNVETKGVIVRARVPLSYMYGFRQPIKIGAEDWVVQGTADEILASFACFENYEIIGSTLDDNGHWRSDTGSIQVQMENVNSRGNVNKSPFDIMFKYALERITKFLNPMAIVDKQNCAIFGNCNVKNTLDNLKKGLEYISEFLPGGKRLVDKMIELYKKKASKEEVMEEMIAFFEAEQKRKDEIREQWIGWDNVDNNQKLMVTLTMYTKPDHMVRSTYDLKKGTVTMRDVGEAIKIALDRKK